MNQLQHNGLLHPGNSYVLERLAAPTVEHEDVADTLVSLGTWN